MAETAIDVSATTTTVPLRLGGGNCVRFTFTGTYSGVTGYLQGSNDGTSYVNVTGVREDNGALVGGLMTIGSTNFSVIVSAVGWSYVRFLPAAISSGTVSVKVKDGSNFGLPLGVVPISLASAQTTVTSSSSAALVVGPNGATNPAFNVDASASSAATGLNVAAAAAAGGVAVSVLSSGTNENLTVDAKGSGTITVGGTSTGNVVLGTPGHTLTLNNTTGAVTVAAGGLTVTAGGLTVTAGGATVTAGGLTVTAGNLLLSSGTATVTSTGSSALAVGANGATNPVLRVDAATASVATGLKVTGAAAAGGVALAAISSGTNENLTVDAKGSGTITLGGTSTGSVTVGANALFKLAGTLTAGGLTTCGVQVGTGGPVVYSGSGAPTINAAVKGSLYLRSDGSGTSDRLYVATDTAGTWTAVTTAA